MYLLLLSRRHGALRGITASSDAQSFVSLQNHVDKVLPVAELLQSRSERQPEAFPATILKPVVQQTCAVAKKVSCLDRFHMLLAGGGIPTKVGSNMACYPSLLKRLPDGTVFTRCIYAGFKLTSWDGVLFVTDLCNAIKMGPAATADQQKLEFGVHIRCSAAAQYPSETQHASTPLAQGQRRIKTFITERCQRTCHIPQGIDWCSAVEGHAAPFP
mmetsp:Transcript_89203/g.177356  ORF Transcript_89203/g.177356 Transcript_89203/m.177356 type:complete len:215 (-) Transcript_89203:52-696(-)